MYVYLHDRAAVVCDHHAALPGPRAAQVLHALPRLERHDGAGLPLPLPRSCGGGSVANAFVCTTTTTITTTATTTTTTAAVAAT